MLVASKPGYAMICPDNLNLVERFLTQSTEVVVNHREPHMQMPPSQQPPGPKRQAVATSSGRDMGTEAVKGFTVAGESQMYLFSLFRTLTEHLEGVAEFAVVRRCLCCTSTPGHLC